jgi:hypothetical protein
VAALVVMAAMHTILGIIFGLLYLNQVSDPCEDLSSFSTSP